MLRVLFAAVFFCISSSVFAEGVDIRYVPRYDFSLDCGQFVIVSNTGNPWQIRIFSTVTGVNSEGQRTIYNGDYLVTVHPYPLNSPLLSGAEIDCTKDHQVTFSWKGGEIIEGSSPQRQGEREIGPFEFFARMEEERIRKNKEFEQKKAAEEQARRDAEAEKERANQLRKDNQARAEQARAEQAQRDKWAEYNNWKKTPKPQPKGEYNCINDIYETPEAARRAMIQCDRERERQLAKEAAELKESEAEDARRQSADLANAQRQATEAQQAQQLLENQRYAAAIQESNQRQAEQERQERIEAQRVARENYAESVAGMNRDLEKSRGVTRSMINNNDSLSDLISNSR